MADTIANLVEGRHPAYAEKFPHWEFVSNTYEGGREWFKGNIFQFVKEGDVEYEKRLARAYRFNHTKQVVDQVDKYLFKMPVSRKTEDAPDAVKLFWKRASRDGMDIDTFFKRVSNMTSQYGRIGIVVDSTVAPGQVTTRADEKAGKGQIYAYIVTPQDMLDMSYDLNGQLNWILIREFMRDDEDPLDSSKQTRERFRLWTRDKWVLYETQVIRGKRRYVEIDTKPHTLGVVPVILADNVKNESEFVAPGMIDDIAYLDRAVANYLSNLDAIIQDQTFSQLAMPAQGLLPGEEGHDKLIDMSTKRVFLFNGEAGTQPFYLAPDPKQAELILKAIGKIINEIYHSIGLTGERTQEDNGGGIDNSSGVAKSYDFERVNSLLSSKSASLQLIEEQVLSMVMTYSGDPDEPVQGLVEYPKEFDVRSVYDEFEIAAQLSLITAPDEVRREQMRALIKKLFPAASDKVAELLEASLKDWPPELLLPTTGLGAPKVPGSGADPLKAASAQKTAKKLAA